MLEVAYTCVQYPGQRRYSRFKEIIIPYIVTGFGGNPRLADVGGVPYLMPHVQREKVSELCIQSRKNFFKHDVVEILDSRLVAKDTRILISGGSRIFHVGAPTSKMGTPFVILLFLPTFL